MNEREAYIALNMMEKIGPVTVRAMVLALGSARAVFDADRSALMMINGIGRETADAITAQAGGVDWAGELDRVNGLGGRIITQVDKEYPGQLLEIHDPPLALYVMGSFESRDRHSIAVVGTRRPSHYGREWAEKLAFQAVKAGFTVVSGLARGVDTAAHEGVLKAKGRTIAVMGSALDCIYPASNADLARRVSESGAVITEFPLGRQPDKTTFPMRNRIISGLSMGVLVVEAGIRSGALITANQAVEQGRSVFAMPGRIDSPGSSGCHKLIKSGARLVTGIDDILAEYEFLIAPGMASAERSSVRPLMSEEELCLMRFLEEGEQNVDSLIRVSGMKPSSVGSLLVGLEIKRMIKMLPGRVVEVVRR